MRPYGSDRLREVAGKAILHSRTPKGWTARVLRTNTSAEFPGTAIYWDEQYFEVVSAEALPAGGYRYVLEPWKDENTFRVFDAYDEPSEAARVAAYHAALARERNRTRTNLLAVFAGHLPSTVQEHLASEWGVVAPRMTMISAVPPLIIFGLLVYFSASAVVDQKPNPFTLPSLFLGGYMAIDSGFRLLIATLGNRPLGSFPGLLLYIAYYYLFARNTALPGPFDSPKGAGLFTLPPSDDIVLRDKLATRGALLTLLSREEQLQLAERYGFDYREHAHGMAWIILIGSTLGAITSAVKFVHGDSPLSIITVFVAGALLVEQVKRLLAFRSGPAGSMLAFAVRPFLRDLLEPR
ncbi:MAG TPA: hypothetical protein VFN10_10770 [Thermoanaerobaculia bacterium]|nr:hypothetical protein [Thermoanaerobaculia bacterium]